MPINKIKGAGIAVKGLGKAFKDFKTKRIDAINRKIQRASNKRAATENYIEEYGNIQESKATTKKQYKAEQKKVNQMSEKERNQYFGRKPFKPSYDE